MSKISLKPEKWILRKKIDVVVFYASSAYLHSFTYFCSVLWFSKYLLEITLTVEVRGALCHGMSHMTLTVRSWFRRASLLHSNQQESSLGAFTVVASGRPLQQVVSLCARSWAQSSLSHAWEHKEWQTLDAGLPSHQPVKDFNYRHYASPCHKLQATLSKAKSTCFLPAACLYDALVPEATRRSSLVLVARNWDQGFVRRLWKKDADMHHVIRCKALMSQNVTFVTLKALEI